MRRIFLVVGIILLPLVPIVLVVTGVLRKDPVPLPRVQLSMWGTVDEAKAFTSIIARYRTTHPNVRITYRKIQSEDYLNQLTNAWASNAGPDIFFVPNTWVGQMTQFATAMPKDIAIGQLQFKKTLFGTSSEAIKPPQPAPSVNELRSAYVEAVMEDIYLNGKVWGLPLSMDTLVLYYNRDLLNNAKIFEPAKTWPELLTQVIDSGLTQTDEEGTIVQSAIALGTADNLPHATDILALLMMQNGTVMITNDNDVQINSPAGQIAMDFFASFAQPGKKSYSWNSDQPHALDAFRSGKLAYYIGTLSDRPAIAASNIAWSVTPMLHTDSRGDTDGATRATRFINSAAYQVPMVSKQSQTNKKSVYAWNFLRYIAHSDNVQSYLADPKKLSAQRKILSSQSKDAEIGVFAGQLLTARSWYHGRDARRMEEYLRELINALHSGRSTTAEALQRAADQIETTL